MYPNDSNKLAEGKFDLDAKVFSFLQMATQAFHKAL